MTRALAKDVSDAKPSGARVRTRKDGVETRKTILEAAERLFSQYGLDGVSIREITKAANVDLALVNYHFKSKENLFREAMALRVDEMNSERLLLLSQVNLRVNDEDCLVEILDAFTRPFVGLTQRGSKKLSNYRKLVALVANSHHWQSVVFEQHYDPTARKFVEALQHVLPSATPAAIYWSVSFFLGAMVNAFAETGRVDRLSEGICRSSDLGEVRSNLIQFTIGGLLRTAAIMPRSTTN